MLYSNRFLVADILIGCHPIRVIQRAWRRFQGRKRLVLCMAWCEKDSLLGRVMRTLCVEDLKRLVL